ncbi:MAG: hypothetical protein FWE84_00160 [Firmicutes bacterium]|nr:hypothetical protein [Bacillota bacterium]
MKPLYKNIIIVASAVAAAVLVAVLVLSLISIKPINRLGWSYDDSNYEVLTAYNQVQPKNEEKTKAFNAAVASVKFSVMKSLFQGSADYDIKPKTFTNKDGAEEHRKYTVEKFSEEIRPLSNEFMILLKYGKPVTNARIIDGDGNPYRFDRVVLRIPESGKKMQEIRLYAYLEANMDNQIDSDEYDENGIIGSVYYYVYEFTAKMYTYDFFRILSEDDHFKTGIGSEFY